MIFNQLQDQLKMLLEMLYLVADESYAQPVRHLEGASIGQHTRHIIELLQCAENGKKTGVVDYVNRNRNLSLESNKQLAIAYINKILIDLDTSDAALKLQVAIRSEANDSSLVDTSYFREVVYNTEHIIHHMALIKVALIEFDILIDNPLFGYAYSTIQYRQSLVSQNEA